MKLIFMATARAEYQETEMKTKHEIWNWALVFYLTGSFAPLHELKLIYDFNEITKLEKHYWRFSLFWQAHALYYK